MTELARQAISHPTYFQTTCRNAITAWQYTDKTAEIQVANVLSFKDYFEYVLQK